MNPRQRGATLVVVAAVAVGIFGSAAETSRGAVPLGGRGAVMEQTQIGPRVQVAVAGSVATRAFDRLRGSAGTVLGPDSRAALQSALTALAMDSVQAIFRSHALPAAARSLLPAELPGFEVGAVPEGLSRLPLDSADVDAASARVSADVAAWNVEQQRIAAERAASASRAAAYGSRTIAPVRVAGGSHYTVRVRMNISVGADPAPAQAAIDAGGTVGVFYSGVGVMDVSSHTNQNSLALRLRVGDTVTFTGSLGGTYVVTGSIWVPRVASQSLLLQLGTAVTMQTCQASNMRIVGLRPA